MTQSNVIPLNKHLMNLGLKIAKEGVFNDMSPGYQAAVDEYDKAVSDVVSTAGLDDDSDLYCKNPWLVNEFGGLSDSHSELAALVVRAAVTALDSEAQANVLHLALLIADDKVVKNLIWSVGLDRNAVGAIHTKKGLYSYVQHRCSDVDELEARLNYSIDLLCELGVFVKAGDCYKVQAVFVKHPRTSAVLLNALAMAYQMPYAYAIPIPRFLKIKAGAELIDLVECYKLDYFADELGLTEEIERRAEAAKNA